MQSRKEIMRITLLPFKREIGVSPHETIQEALISHGVALRSDCGGKGVCGKCAVKASPLSALSPPDPDEASILEKRSGLKGHRLACRTRLRGDVFIEIPLQSQVRPDIISKAPVILPPQYQSSGWQPCKGEVFGIAVDLGTTTIAVYLLSLTAKTLVSSVSLKNPQGIFGDDVMSRIAAVGDNKNNLFSMQSMAVKAIEWGIASMSDSFGIECKSVKKGVVVGNTTMIHILAGENPSSIGVAPYQPLFYDERHYNAGELGFQFNPGAVITTLPLISGFLGCDILAAAIAADLENATVGTLLVDIGTNGEIMLKGKDGIYATSCATGPAFEGASISSGMHAVSGAIDRVRISEDKNRLHCSIIPQKTGKIEKPSGICGTGVVSAIAEFLRSGILLADGRFNSESDFPKLMKTSPVEIVLASIDETESGLPITLTQKDVRAIQLAKGALYTGIEILCMQAGIEKPERILLAGAFGSFLDKKDVTTIGMLPDTDEKDIEILGNAAGVGAIMTLFEEKGLQRMKELAEKTTVIELASILDFQIFFASSLSFPLGLRRKIKLKPCGWAYR